VDVRSPHSVVHSLHLCFPFFSFSMYARTSAILVLPTFRTAPSSEFEVDLMKLVDETSRSSGSSIRKESSQSNGPSSTKRLVNGRCWQLKVAVCLCLETFATCIVYSGTFCDSRNTFSFVFIVAVFTNASYTLVWNLVWTVACGVIIASLAWIKRRHAAFVFYSSNHRGKTSGGASRRKARAKVKTKGNLSASKFIKKRVKQ